MAARRVYRFAEVEVDPSQACVRRRGQPHYPRSKVLQVLLYLLEHRERLVPKEELIEQVWKGTAVTEGVVFHCIADIRTLLDDDPRNPRFVRTFPATGYRFVAPVEEVWVESGVAWRLPRWVVWAGGAALLAAPAVWIGIGRSSRNASPPRDEVAWWRFDEGAGTRVKDSSGHGNEGVLVDGPVWADGILGKALRFDGVSGFVSGTGSGRGFPRGSAPRTVTAWIRTASAAGDLTSIFHYGSEGSPYYTNLALYLRDNGHLAFGYTAEEVQGTSRLDDGAWHFVAGVYEGPETNLARVFVGGVQESARKLPRRLETGSTSRWRIGRFMQAGTPFRGVIDDVRLYARGLSPTEVMALYRCSGRQVDVILPGERPFCYLPLFPSGAPLLIGAQGQIRYAGNDFAGVQLAQCGVAGSLGSLRGAGVGQDLSMGVDLLAPAQPGGAVTAAGPYFRGRAAAPGDGLFGGTNAGYWVQLYSTGVVKVRRLNPQQVIAFTPAPAGFDSSRFHRVEMAARGQELEVSLDGKLLEFDQGGRPVRRVSIPPVWEGPPPVGDNRGTAGIAFSCEPRGQAGGQQARNLVVTPLPPMAIPSPRP